MSPPSWRGATSQRARAALEGPARLVRADPEQIDADHDPDGRQQPRQKDQRVVGLRLWRCGPGVPPQTGPAPATTRRSGRAPAPPSRAAFEGAIGHQKPVTGLPTPVDASPPPPPARAWARGRAAGTGARARRDNAAKPPARAQGAARRLRAAGTCCRAGALRAEQQHAGDAAADAASVRATSAEADPDQRQGLARGDEADDRSEGVAHGDRPAGHGQNGDRQDGIEGPGHSCRCVGIGLYSLFISRNLPVPDWLCTIHVDEPKYKLVGNLSQ